VTASGSMIAGAMAAVDTVNAVAIPGAKTSYELMCKILGNNEAPLIFASLPISAAAIVGGLVAYEATSLDCNLIYGRIGLEPPKA
jgi:hypothetical protein